MFFIDNLDYLFFVEGLGFVLLGGVCMALNKSGKYSLPWMWFGLFSITYGFGQWLSILAMFLGDSFIMRCISIIITALSYFFLIEFGLFGLKVIKWKGPGQWIMLVLLFVGCLGVFYGLDGLNVSVSYSLGLVGGLLSALALVDTWRSHKNQKEIIWFLFFGILMFVFATATGLIVPGADFFPASFFNQDVFLNIIKIPVQLFFGLLAWAATGCAWFILQTDRPIHKWLSVIVFIISTFAILVGGWWFVKKASYSRQLQEKEQVLKAGRLSAASTDPELIKSLTGSLSDINLSQYVLLKNRLIEMRKSLPGFRFIYLMYAKGDSIGFFADSEPSTSTDYSAPGDYYADAPPDLHKIFSGQWPQLTVGYTDTWGEWLSAFVPLHDTGNGKIIAVLGIDRSMAIIRHNIAADRIRIIFIILLLMLLLVIFYVINEIQRRAYDLIANSEKELKVSGEKLRSLINHLHAGVVVHGPDKSISLINSQASLLLGVTAGQSQGKNAIAPELNFLRDDGSIMPLEEYPVNQVIAQGRPLQNYIVGIDRPSAQGLVWVLVNAFPEFNIHRQLIQVVVTFIDITELKQAEEALIESENLNRLVIENQGEGIGIVDLMETFIFANPAADQMFGLQTGGLVGHNLIDFIVPGYFQIIQLETEKRSKSEKSTYEIEIITKTGGNRNLLVTATPRYDNKGIHNGTFGVFRDITDRKKAENALRESEERYKAAFRTIPEAIALTTFEGVFIEINEGFVTLSGYSRQEAIGFSTIEINLWVNLDDRVYVVENLRDHGVVENFETRFRCKNGAIITALYAACTININNIPHILSVIRDITERKQIETDLIKAKENAEESDRLKSAFLANMSHEIRTPMNIILGFLNHLEDESLQSLERQELISIMKRKGQELITIINDIIDVSMIDSKQLVIKKTTFNLNQLLETLRLSFENEKIQTDKTSILIHVEKALSNNSSYIISDEIRLAQILNNLIGNALKFTSTGHINFGYRIDNENILFFVEDTGKGIAKEKFSIIWERFRQVEESNSRSFGGVGLGLSISKELIGMLGGRLWFISEEENLSTGKAGGSTFFFTLPVSVLVKKDVEVRDAEDKQVNFDFTGKTILIAEDIPENFDVIRVNLRRFNPVLVHAANGTKAVEICKINQNIDLILMDIRMPGMDGYEATREIRKFRTNLPIIAITAYGFMEDKAQSIAAGCNNFISKPIDFEKLVKMIANYLKNKHEE